MNYDVLISRNIYNYFMGSPEDGIWFRDLNQTELSNISRIAFENNCEILIQPIYETEDKDGGMDKDI